jgi:AcrR family transcriptional regulator
MNVFDKRRNHQLTPEKAPIGTRRQRQKAETKTSILAAARALFEERGFDGTTMRAVASNAEVGLGTIFAHFPDKGALLIAALLEDLARTDQRILETLPEEAPIKEQIMHLAEAGFGYWCRRPALSATLLREMWFVQGQWAEKRREETARFIDFVFRLLDEARRRGEIRADVDLRRTAEALYSFYVGIIIRAAGDGRLDLGALLEDTEDFVGQLLAGLGNRPS